MKLYYFMVIAIGLMYTFSLAGIDTGSSRILSRLTSDNLTDTVIDYDEGDYSTYQANDINGENSWWKILAIVIAVALAVGVVSGIRVFGSGVDVTAGITVLSAGLASALFTMFAIDIFSILIHMREITGGTGWEYNLTWILIMPILFGFGFSLIQFIKNME